MESDRLTIFAHSLAGRGRQGICQLLRKLSGIVFSLIRSRTELIVAGFPIELEANLNCFLFMNKTQSAALFRSNQRRKLTYGLANSFFILALVSGALAENNGISLRPALGWSSWSFIRNQPKESKIEAQALAMHQNLQSHGRRGETGWQRSFSSMGRPVRVLRNSTKSSTSSSLRFRGNKICS